MARRFRWFGKKRGARRTGSRLVGTLGEALFFGALFLLGSAALASLIAAQVLNPRPELYRIGYGFWLMTAVLVSFILIGGGGVILAAVQLSISAERRSAFARRAAQIDLLQEPASHAQAFPHVPRGDNLTNSPGVRLKFRLPVNQAPGWTLTLAAVFALAWNGIASVLTVWAVNSHLQGQPEWFLCAFLLPFWAVGIALAQGFLRQISVRSVVGPTTVEINRLPLYPGQPCEVYLAQAGRVVFDSLELTLVCEEETTYHQGTDVRTECRVVHRFPVARWEKLRIHPQWPFEHQCRVHIPEAVMHSFQSPHNAIHWKLLIRGVPHRRVPLQRSFPVVVYPADRNVP